VRTLIIDALPLLGGEFEEGETVRIDVAAGQLGF
jgi:hypothetical protein